VSSGRAATHAQRSKRDIIELEALYQAVQIAKHSKRLGLLLSQLRLDGALWSDVLQTMMKEERMNGR
jgi:hypothetical protein